MSSIILKHDQAQITLTTSNAGLRQLTVVPLTVETYIHRHSCLTGYSDDVIQAILKAKGPAYLCDEIAREEDPHYIRPHVELSVTAYIDPERLANKRLLDFGCGAGASTTILAQLLPHTKIIGVELDSANLQAAKARTNFYNLKNVTLLKSPAGDKLPDDIGLFDVIMLSAVYEHLLPNERQTLLPMLWSHLKPGGVILFDETPWRWFPLESHTTGLPFINYLPDTLAYSFARTCSKRISPSATWPTLLRDGIRGGTAKKILQNINSPAIVIKPRRLGVLNQADLWCMGYANHSLGLSGKIKRIFGFLASIICRLTNIAIVPYLTVAIKKLV